ncbi:STAS domain-containing protein [Mycolicibacterium sp.]|uniref:STAS domain-containing protein n=1 Tax=Mycolicibacterium sp. TaxID=2320850 RepID=UPI0037C5D6CA
MSLSFLPSNSDPPTRRIQLSAEWPGTADVRITVIGDVDMSTARQFSDYVLRSAANCRRIALDMTRVTFFDCTGLSALYSIEDRCRMADVTLNLEPAQCVSRVITLCESLCA